MLFAKKKTKKTYKSTSAGKFMEMNWAKDVATPSIEHSQSNLTFIHIFYRQGNNIPLGMVTDQFGMIGLLTFIRAAETDPGMVHLALGSDLTTLGLNLNSPE